MYLPKFIVVTFLFIFLGSCTSKLGVTTSKVVERHPSSENSSKWSYKPKGKTIVIGDVHADPRALLDILIDQKVLDSFGRFIAKDIDLVLLGDYADKGPDTRGVWDIINYLEIEAKKRGSRTHALVGNHDMVVLMENLKRMYPEDLVRFKDFDQDPVMGVKKALTAKSYRQMMQKWKAVIKIGDTIYTHGGLGEWIYSVHPREINKILHDYILDQQKYLDEVLAGKNPSKVEVPNILRSWDFDSSNPMPDNPFWSREMSKQRLSSDKFEGILDYLDAKKIIVGHTPTKSKKIETIYNGKMILTDTKISRGMKKGSLSALEVSKSGKVKKYNKISRGKSKKAYTRIFYKNSSCDQLMSYLLKY